jgi:cell wall-associated NlpC family hydrolase
VPKNKLSPGDLIFFGTTADPHHVGMYIGNGMFIHAPHTGDFIRIAVLADRSDYLTARRVN